MAPTRRGKYHEGIRKKEERPRFHYSAMASVFLPLLRWLAFFKNVFRHTEAHSPPQKKAPFSQKVGIMQRDYGFPISISFSQVRPWDFHDGL